MENEGRGRSGERWEIPAVLAVGPEAFRLAIGRFFLVKSKDALYPMNRKLSLFLVFISDRQFRFCRRCDEIRFAGQVDDTGGRQIRQKRHCRVAVREESAPALL